MSKIEQKEKRQFLRLNAYHLVKYRPLASDKEGASFVLAALKDISSGGVCLRVEESLPVSTTIELKINFPHVNTAIPCLAKIVWVRQRTPGSPYEMGAQFTDIDESLRHIIDGNIKRVRQILKDKRIS